MDIPTAPSPLAPRALPAAGVVLVHVALLALLMAPLPRLVPAQVAPLVVQLIEAASTKTPAPVPAPPRPSLHEAPKVQVPLPSVTITAEIVAAKPTEARVTSTTSAPQQPAPVAVAVAVEPPRFDLAYLENPAPAYPQVSRRMREQGRVLLNVLVTRDGRAESVEVRNSSGSDRLDRAALEAVRHWRFLPARRGEETVSAWALVPIVFQLES